MAGHSVVQYVDFGVDGDEDVVRNSFGAITNYEAFSPSGQPVPGGVYDPRLGTISHDYLCLTCAHGKKLCPGHRGHIALRVPVPLSFAVAEIRRWLRVTCFQCGEILVERERYEGLPPKRRLAEAATVATEGRRCPRRGCGAVHPAVVKDDEDYFTFRVRPAGPPAARAPAGRARAPAAAAAAAAEPPRGEKLYPDAIRAILERVTDAAAEGLGRGPAGHPRRLVARAIPVPPNTIRPGVRSFGGSGSSYHDSTNLLQHLIKRNAQFPEQLPPAMGAPGLGPIDGELDRSVQNYLQIYYDYTYGSSGTSAMQGQSGRRAIRFTERDVNSILRGLARKAGRIRANLLGKRVFNISRSTISGNMRLRIDEVGIPLAFARTLQVEDPVREDNLEWLMAFVLNGRRDYPGCTLVWQRATGAYHDVANLRDFRLEPGDVVFRDVVDGDLAFFNRQPTLERSSIGVHRVVVIRDEASLTFQMNVLSCEWYNADQPSRSATGSCLERCNTSLGGKQCKCCPGAARI